jgi:hypothetical protein
LSSTKRGNDAHLPSIWIEGPENAEHLDDLPPYRQLGLRVDEPVEDEQELRIVDVRVDDRSRIACDLTERLQRSRTKDGRRSCLKGLDDESEDLGDSRTDALSGDLGELPEATQDVLGDDGSRF